MDFQSFKEKQAASQASLTAIQEFTKHLSRNKHFLGKEEWRYLPKIRARKSDISWILGFLELASEQQVSEFLWAYLAKRPRLQIDKESYVERMVEFIQPQVPQFLLQLMFERILEVSQPFHARPQADEKYLEVISVELQAVKDVMNLMIVSERIFDDAEKELSRRFAEEDGDERKGRGPRAKSVAQPSVSPTC